MSFIHKYVESAEPLSYIQRQGLWIVNRVSSRLTIGIEANCLELDHWLSFRLALLTPENSISFGLRLYSIDRCG